MEFQEACKIMWDKLGDYKIMGSGNQHARSSDDPQCQLHFLS